MLNRNDVRYIQDVFEKYNMMLRHTNKKMNINKVQDKMSEFTNRINKEEIERIHQQIDSLCFLSSDRNGSIRFVIYFLCKTMVAKLVWRKLFNVAKLLLIHVNR